MRIAPQSVLFLCLVLWVAATSARGASLDVDREEWRKFESVVSELQQSLNTMTVEQKKLLDPRDLHLVKLIEEFPQALEREQAEQGSLTPEETARVARMLKQARNYCAD